MAHKRDRVAYHRFGGLELRHFVFDRGTATPFVIVATLVLGAFIVGGRFAVRRLIR